MKKYSERVYDITLRTDSFVIMVLYYEKKISHWSHTKNGNELEAVEFSSTEQAQKTVSNNNNKCEDIYVYIYICTTMYHTFSKVYIMTWVMFWNMKCQKKKKNNESSSVVPWDWRKVITNIHTLLFQLFLFHSSSHTKWFFFLKLVTEHFLEKKIFNKITGKVSLFIKSYTRLTKATMLCCDVNKLRRYKLLPSIYNRF